MSIKSQAKLDKFKSMAAHHINELHDLINAMPSKGDVEADCQRLCLLNRLSAFEHHVNGVIVEDFEE